LFSDEKMTGLNALVDGKKLLIEEAASSFLYANQLIEDRQAPAAAKLGIDAGLWVATYEHLGLVVMALLLSCLFGVPLGVIAYRHRRFGQAVIAVTGILQTIPSLALLCFLIPVLGIGARPTIFALFVYGLLPIVQSTLAGLLALDPKLIETARVLGLTQLQRLRLIELPLASINIMAGVKTAAVINVGTATIAALIGAGGYGRYITSGLAMNDVSVILKGAIPTALLAVGFHGLFELLGRFVVPRGLRGA
jgi:osmoprotectant transport system permease protein